MRHISAAVVIAALALGSCADGLTERQAGEAHDVARDAAYEVVRDSARIAELEARIMRLERRLEGLDAAAL